MKEIEPGGYLFYDNTKPLPPSKFRDDINVIGMPLTEICNSAYSDPRERQLFKNIIYVGALAALMDLEPNVIAELIGEQYKGKEKLLKPNLNALQMGLNHAREHLEGRDRPEGQARLRGRRPDLHRRQRRGGARHGLRRRHGLRLVPDHAVVLACRGFSKLLLQIEGRQRHRQE